MANSIFVRNEVGVSNGTDSLRPAFETSYSYASSLSGPTASVVAITRKQLSPSEAISTGSGILISKNLVLTAGHVMKATSGYSYMASLELNRPETFQANGQSVPVFLGTSSTGTNDLAVLKTSNNLVADNSSIMGLISSTKWSSTKAKSTLATAVTAGFPGNLYSSLEAAQKDDTREGQSNEFSAQRLAPVMMQMKVSPTVRGSGSLLGWSDASSVGAAGHSGGGMWVDFDGQTYIAGTFTYANATGNQGLAGNGSGVGGMLLTPDTVNKLLSAVEKAERNYKTDPKNIILGGDTGESENIRTSYRSDFIEMGDGTHRVYGSTGNDFIHGTSGTVVMDYRSAFDGDALVVKQLIAGDIRKYEKSIGGMDAGVDTLTGVDKVYLPTDTKNLKIKKTGSQSGSDAFGDPTRLASGSQEEKLYVYAADDGTKKALDFSEWGEPIIFGSAGDFQDRGASEYGIYFRNFDNIIGTDFGDTIVMSQGMEAYYGGKGKDDIKASHAENAKLFGGEGDDTLRGNGKNTILDGGKGDDILIGSLLGSDTFIYSGGNDIIKVADATDRLYIRLSNFDGFNTKENEAKGIQLHGGYGDPQKEDVWEAAAIASGTVIVQIRPGVNQPMVDYDPLYAGVPDTFFPLFDYEKLGRDLIVHISNNGANEIGTVTIQNFHDGDLGLHFDGSERLAVSPYAPASVFEAYNNHVRSIFDNGVFADLSAYQPDSPPLVS